MLIVLKILVVVCVTILVGNGVRMAYDDYNKNRSLSERVADIVIFFCGGMAIAAFYLVFAAIIACMLYYTGLFLVS